MLDAFGPSTVIAIVIGVAITIFAFLPFVAIRYRKTGRLRALDVIILVAVMIYAMTLWTYTLIPVPQSDVFECTKANFQPFQFIASIRDDGRALQSNWAFLQVAFNVVFFVPLGVFIRLVARRGVVVATLVGLGISALIEFTQLTGIWGIFHCAYRYFDVDDIIVNTTGSLIGSFIGIPVVWLLGRSRPAPRATSVTLGRRLIGMLADIMAMAFIGYPTVIAWRAVGLYVLGIPAFELSSVVDQLLALGLPALIQAFSVLRRGRTLGEAIVQLNPVARPDVVILSRIVKYATGVGGYLLLTSAWVPIWILPIFGIITIVMAVRGDHRGLSHTVARMTLELEPSRVNDVADDPPELPPAER